LISLAQAIYYGYIAIIKVLELLIMSKAIGTVFENNRTQAVRLPAEMRFPESVKKVTVRAVGKDRIISPVENTWDSFFLNEKTVSDDFMSERAEQIESERESL
jgi:antitoxin VapB